jgi:hypothetical protein
MSWLTAFQSAFYGFLPIEHNNNMTAPNDDIQGFEAF